ncbi:hypothetical protein FE257_001220 [Aspergillus nanangensis]|uniref:Uncharacterized protein n=1 Tax=Aspergillus nanangensis TaxID=2582783 RepID=A0AAD4GP35_ASPNN|nr:hypothetical protein FE257_001220 [Aspergillus nanangensis]
MPSFRTVSSILIVTSSTAITYFYLLHRTLQTRITHDSHHGSLSPSLSTTIQSIPPPVFTDDYFSIHDHASRHVPRSLLPNQPPPEELFTLLVRRNMTAFAKFPQAWILRLVVPAVARKTFGASHIHALNFDPGDVVCGVYRVEERTPNKVVFALLFEGPVGGRLVIRYSEADNHEVMVYHSETVMWTKKGSETKRAVLPLERAGLRFLHEMAAWWLLDSGVGYLEGLRGSTGGCL